MTGPCSHAAQLGTAASHQLHGYRQPFKTKALRHQRILRTTVLPRRTCEHATRQRPLTTLAASSTDEVVRPQNDAVRSAQDLAEGVQSFLDDAQKQIKPEEAPLPEHPIGEIGTIDVAEGINAEVRGAHKAAAPGGS